MKSVPVSIKNSAARPFSFFSSTASFSFQHDDLGRFFVDLIKGRRGRPFRSLMNEAPRTGPRIVFWVNEDPLGRSNRPKVLTLTFSLSGRLTCRTQMPTEDLHLVLI